MPELERAQLMYVIRFISCCNPWLRSGLIALLSNVREAVHDYFTVSIIRNGGIDDGIDKLIRLIKQINTKRYILYDPDDRQLRFLHLQPGAIPG